ncbi:GDP-mannose 4,6-dehydratase [Polynucleobacter sp. UB-Raua-W9]|uniref:GDP-mannose 4,6-dehydratase n=1 Tax=Polynucleobacter sp. UB-Raua-W9 TaxID=1819736 RepID=UPI00203F96A0|nr:GDP-mannose 4,6-dehydratase [Polynucleobacter sp. UB-Raua-W9]QWD73283.1 GDP-mannose 4,6-dehydratase [Polynucleobacter sp. UB-Raua-W9]
MKRALICGVSGQDGAYLAQLLLSKGYQVFGGSRDLVKTDFRNLVKLKILDKVILLKIDLSDPASIHNAFSLSLPDEIYNLSGQSSVGLSFEKPEETRQSIVDATFNLLEEVRNYYPAAKLFSAGSGECFGETEGVPANELTAFNPKSPYAESKVAAFNLVKKYRDSCQLFACTGILFNHESPLRPSRFVTQKIISTAIDISGGSSKKLSLGNLAIERDWGWSPDYVEAMWLMLQNKAPLDFVIATGVGHTLEEFINITFSQLGLDWKEYVLIDKTLFRPNEGIQILANPRKAEEILGWKAKINFQQLIKLLLTEAKGI